MPSSALLDSVATPDPPGNQTLVRLTEHVRALLPTGAVAIVTAERFAGWFEDAKLGEALGSVALDDRHRHALVQSALGLERPLFLARLDGWEAAPALLTALVHSLGPEAARRAWRTCRRASVIACPLRAETGRGLGVLIVGSVDRERRLSSTDVRTAEVVADLVAMALERADLLEVETRRARNELHLKRAAEAMSSSLELDDVYRSVVEHAAATSGATRAVLTRVDARAGELRTVVSLDPPRAEAGPVLSGPAVRQVARSRGPLLQRDVSQMHAPIELGPRLYGVLSVAHPEPGRFDEANLDLLARLAGSSAAAIANAIDFQRERQIARSLTLGFVPEPLPRVPGYETGLLYAPALGEPTGGDLYGVWQLPSGEVAVLVGDVAGKGVETAALSSMVRFFIEARSWDAESPARVLEQTNAMLAARLPSDTFVTAFLAVIAPQSLCWASAGHLPPLHLSAGRTRELEATGLPLGVEEETRYEERRLELADGDLVFAYTDGLVEARRGGEPYGAVRLARLVASLAGTLEAEELARAVHEEIAGWSGGLGDDAVALALRRRP
ncbi:MAG: SpoIIE family protein phosphatase [Thermoleophilaceae bacterium]|nr:SpoIIE family protein phosphatase [Thermoleophilaceae bacterium]